MESQSITVRVLFISKMNFVLFSKESEKMHNFTRFAIELNEHEEGVAPTDSRFRVDQRVMEEGDWEKANHLKQKLEAAQRKRREEREKQGIGLLF